MKQKKQRKSALEQFEKLAIQSPEKIKGGTDGEIIVHDDLIVG